MAIRTDFLRAVVDAHIIDPHGSGTLVDQVEGPRRRRRTLEAKLELFSPESEDLFFRRQCWACWGTSGERGKGNLELPLHADNIWIRREAHVFSRHLRFQFFFNLD